MWQARPRGRVGVSFARGARSHPDRRLAGRRSTSGCRQGDPVPARRAPAGPAHVRGGELPRRGSARPALPLRGGRAAIGPRARLRRAGAPGPGRPGDAGPPRGALGRRARRLLGARHPVPGVARLHAAPDVHLRGRTDLRLLQVPLQCPCAERPPDAGRIRVDGAPDPRCRDGERRHRDLARGRAARLHGPAQVGPSGHVADPASLGRARGHGPGARRRRAPDVRRRGPPRYSRRRSPGAPDPVLRAPPAARGPPAATDPGGCSGLRSAPERPELPAGPRRRNGQGGSPMERGVDPGRILAR